VNIEDLKVGMEIEHIASKGRYTVDYVGEVYAIMRAVGCEFSVHKGYLNSYTIVDTEYEDRIKLVADKISTMTPKEMLAWIESNPFKSTDPWIELYKTFTIDSDLRYIATDENGMVHTYSHNEIENKDGEWVPSSHCVDYEYIGTIDTNLDWEESLRNMGDVV